MDTSNPSLSAASAEKETQAFVFFFSSRRRHTRFSRDRSSDVCSSDLSADHCGPGARVGIDQSRPRSEPEIGRASCRERVEISVVAVSLKKKKKKQRRADPSADERNEDKPGITKHTE